MRKTCLIMVIIFGIIGFTQAQGRLQEVVYLKNGSIIRGIIIEQVPNRSLKIETADGSIFVYPMREVAKITKEPYKKKRMRNRYGYPSAPRFSSRYYDPETPRGYRGFVELGYAFGVGDYNNIGRLEVSTTHGYQFNPYLFAGGGIGIHYYNDADECMLPLFGEFRANLSKGAITPYIGVKVGYSFLLDSSIDCTGGFYFSPTIGVRFLVGNDKSINLGFGYSLQQLTYEGNYYHSGSYYYSSSTESMNALHFKVGFEF